MDKIRINKYLTQANYCSRRGADKLIQEGRVKIGSRVAVLGDQVSKNETVFVDGNSILIDKESFVYLAYNKPVGIICSSSENDKDNIVDAIHYDVRVYPIGRLDVASSGLILLTNDGDIVNKILRAEEKVEKEYVVKVDKKINNKFLKSLQDGVDIGGYITLPSKVEKINDFSFKIIITEGKNRQIRKMVEANHYKVKALKRVRIGKLSVNGIKEGQYKEFSLSQIKKLILNR